MQRLRTLGGMIRIVTLLACLSAFPLVVPAVANEVAQWNETTMMAIVANGQSAVVSTRTLARWQVAVHDALNAINRRYDAYYFEGPGTSAASPEAAIAAAAHTVLVGVVGELRHARAEGCDARPGGPGLCRLDRASHRRPARNTGVTVGRSAGAAILALRKDDGATRDAPYTPGMGPGKWRPHPNPVPAKPADRQPGLWLAATCPRR